MINTIQDEINNNLKELIDINKLQNLILLVLNEEQKKSNQNQNRILSELMQSNKNQVTMISELKKSNIKQKNFNEKIFNSIERTLALLEEKNKKANNQKKKMAEVGNEIG